MKPRSKSEWITPAALACLRSLSALVHEHREGRHRFYHLNPEPLRAVDSWLEQYRTFWTTSLNNLKAFVEAEYAKKLGGQGTSLESEPHASGAADSHPNELRPHIPKLESSQRPKEKSGRVEQNRSGHRPRKNRTYRKGDRHS